ncbi:Scarecrow-like protein 23 [Bienertia sinuspersici]
MQGLQWPALFHILSSNNLTSLRLTAFGPSSKLLAQTGARLADFANSLRLPFEYNPIEGNIGGMSTFIKHASHDEVTVVHCMHHHLYDVLGCGVDKLMKVLRVIRPMLVTMVHQDLDVSQTDSSSFLNKFVDALHYYSALFDALGEGEGLLGRDSSVQRYEVEHHLFGTEIRNILALDGRININGGGCHPSWGNHLLQAGFEPFSLSGSPAAQAALLLEMFPSKGYTLMEENGCLKLGWKGLSLLTASAWQPSSNFGHIVSSDHHHSS